MQNPMTQTDYINEAIRTFHASYAVLSEDHYGWELTTVADELLRLSINRDSIVTDADIEFLTAQDQSLLMVSAPMHYYKDGAEVTVYSARIGAVLLYDLSDRFNQLIHDITSEENLE